MYAIVKTGGKQYKVAPGDKLAVEKLEGEAGAKVELQAIAVVDNGKIVADPAEAAKTKVVAQIVEQFRGEKQLVFKFKKRKNYKKLRGHRQQLTRIQIESIGSAKAEKKAAKAADAKPAVKKAPAKKAAAAADKTETKAAAKPAAKKPAAKKAAAKAESAE